jgi:hypothetical protein
LRGIVRLDGEHDRGVGARCGGECDGGYQSLDGTCPLDLTRMSIRARS